MAMMTDRSARRSSRFWHGGRRGGDPIYELLGHGAKRSAPRQTILEEHR